MAGIYKNVQEDMKGLSPLKTIRVKCLECSANNPYEIKKCPAKECSLWPLRSGKGIKGVSALKTIRAKCRDCGEGTYSDVKNCEFTDCTLYYYRFGKNPHIKGNISNLIPFSKGIGLFSQEFQKKGYCRSGWGAFVMGKPLTSISVGFR